MAIAFGSSLGTPVRDTEVQTTTIAMTTNVAVPAAATCYLGVSWYNSGITATVADDGAGGSLTWTQVVQKNGTVDSNRHLALYRAPAPSGLASGTTITATFSGNAFGRAIFGIYGTGIAASSPLDQSNSNQGTTTALNTGSVTTTNNDDFLVGIAWLDGRTTSDTPTSPAIEAIDFNNSLNATWTLLYRIVAATGTYSLAGTWATGPAAGEEWIAIIVADKGDTGGTVVPIGDPWIGHSDLGPGYGPNAFSEDRFVMTPSGVLVPKRLAIQGVG